MPSLEYNDKLHEYKLDGVVLPSVTTILKDCGMMKALKFYTLDGANKGKRRHKLTELYDKDILDYGSIAEEDMPYLEGWIKVKEALKIEVEPSGVEVRLYHPLLRYVGTADRICKLNEIITIVDLKTGAKEKWHVLQLILYGLAYAALYDQPLPNLLSVYLKSNGKYSYKEYDYKDKSFAIAAARVQSWKER